MSDGNRSKLNHKLRKIIDSKITKIPAGEWFKTDWMVRVLTNADRRPRIEIHQVSNLIRERDDVRWVSAGIWEKLKELRQAGE